VTPVRIFFSGVFSRLSDFPFPSGKVTPLPWTPCPFSGQFVYVLSALSLQPLEPKKVSKPQHYDSSVTVPSPRLCMVFCFCSPPIWYFPAATLSVSDSLFLPRLLRLYSSLQPRIYFAFERFFPPTFHTDRRFRKSSSSISPRSLSLLLLTLFLLILYGGSCLFLPPIPRVLLISLLFCLLLMQPFNDPHRNLPLVPSSLPFLNIDVPPLGRRPFTFSTILFPFFFPSRNIRPPSLRPFF